MNRKHSNTSQDTCDYFHDQNPLLDNNKREKYTKRLECDSTSRRDTSMTNDLKCDDFKLQLRNVETMSALI